MYRKILVPLDGSKKAEAVLPYVCELAERFDAEIVLLRVPVAADDDLLLTGPKLAMATNVRAEALRCEAIDYLERLATELEDIGLHVMTLVREGPVVETILDCAEKVHADSIALATCGRGGAGYWMLGSVTYRVLHYARVLVLVVSAESSQAGVATEERTFANAATKGTQWSG